MKKLFAFLLVAATMLSMCVVLATANDVCDVVEFRDEDGNPTSYTKIDGSGAMITTDELQNGIVPKVESDVIKIDGQQEAAYYQGLRVNCTRVQGGADSGDAPTGEAWLVYDDNYLYAFVQVYDKSPFHIKDLITICPECGKQRGKDSGCQHMDGNYDKITSGTGEIKNVNMWDDDCIELMLDYKNNGGTASQYRISRDGYMSRDWDTLNTGFSGKGFDNGAEGWSAEFAISLDSSKEGTQLGLTFMLHSMTELYSGADGKYRESYSMMNSSSALGGPWDSKYFDYIELGALKTDIIKDTLPSSGPSNGPTDNNSDGPTAPPASNGPSNPTGPNPPTGDPIVMVILAAVAALGAAVVVKKTCFNK